MMDRYGTDAFRFTLAAFAAQGRDVKFSEERVEGYRHFVNKLWNASRFIMMNIKKETGSFSEGSLSGPPVDLPSRWILSRLSVVADEMNRALEEYRFNDAASSIYQFIWHEFCDWYIEMAKIELSNEKAEAGVKWCLLRVLDVSLRLLHPFMPFITEEIWQMLKNFGLEIASPETGDKESIMLAAYPKSLPRDVKAEEEIAYILEAVTGIRNIRGELNISPSVKLFALIKTDLPAAENIVRDNANHIRVLAKLDRLETGRHLKKPAGSATSIRKSMEIYIPLKGVLNVSAEIDRLIKERKKIEVSLDTLNKKLLNDDFLRKAPQEIIEKEKAKYDELIHMRDKITTSIKILEEAGVNNDA